VKIYFLTLILVLPQIAISGMVNDICSKSDVPVINLEYRNRSKNIIKIHKNIKGNHLVSIFLKDFYNQKSIPNDEDKLVQIAKEAVSKNLKNSSLKKLFVKYAMKKDKLKDKKGFKKALIDSIKITSPITSKKLNEYRKLSNNLVKHTYFGPREYSNNTDYGATFSMSEDPTDGKLSLFLYYSFHNSEAIPNLIPLIAHELVHFESYKKKNKIRGNLVKTMEFNIVDEAKAFNEQIKIYIDLIKKEPDLFCNYLYVSWAYGNLIIPVSWHMSSMENALRNGEFIDSYAKTSSYKNHKFLLDKSTKKLRSDLRDKINEHKLQFVTMK